MQKGVEVILPIVVIPMDMTVLSYLVVNKKKEVDPRTKPREGTKRAAVSVSEP